MTITLRLFGPLELRDATGVSCEDVLSQTKRAAVLAYLAAAQPFGFQRRDKLLALFWPESEQHAARRSLNQAVHFLRRHMGAECLTSRGADEIGLTPGTIACDTIAFQGALDRADWAAALAEYRGDLLDGFFVSGVPEFEQWLESARVVYRGAAVRAAWTLSDEWAARGEVEQAKQWALWAVAREPNDESCFRRYLALLDRAGDRAAAMQAYAEFASRLDRELAIAPSPETTALATAIRDGTTSLGSDTGHAAVFGTVAACRVEDSEQRASRSGGLARRVDRGGAPIGVTVAPPVAPPVAHTAGARAIVSPVPWGRLGLIGAAAAMTLGGVRLAVLRLGLPDWQFLGASILVAIGLTVMVVAALAEHRRSLGVAPTGRLGEWFSWRRVIMAGVVSWSALGLAALGHWTTRMLGIGPAATLLSKGVLGNQEEIVVAQFENHTGDSLLGHAMTEDLSQSRSVRLANADRIASTLRFMAADPATLVSRTVARNVAQRLGIKVVVA
jgi:DNA-binding SARP family transcriptional activator